MVWAVQGAAGARISCFTSVAILNSKRLTLVPRLSVAKLCWGPFSSWEPGLKCTEHSFFFLFAQGFLRKSLKYNNNDRDSVMFFYLSDLDPKEIEDIEQENRIRKRQSRSFRELKVATRKAWFPYNRYDCCDRRTLKKLSNRSDFELIGFQLIAAITTRNCNSQLQLATRNTQLATRNSQLQLATCNSQLQLFDSQFSWSRYKIDLK